MENSYNYDAMARAELSELDNVRKVWDTELLVQRNKYSEMLNGEMGKDMMDVLEGRKTVDTSKKEKIRFKIKCFFEKLFRIL